MAASMVMTSTTGPEAAAWKGCRRKRLRKRMVNTRRMVFIGKTPSVNDYKPEWKMKGEKGIKRAESCFFGLGGIVCTKQRGTILEKWREGRKKPIYCRF
jgi:hypothetical protein